MNETLLYSLPYIFSVVWTVLIIRRIRQKEKKVQSFIIGISATFIIFLVSSVVWMHTSIDGFSQVFGVMYYILGFIILIVVMYFFLITSVGNKGHLLKWTLRIIGIFVIVIAITTYVSFFGTPIGKGFAKQQIEEYLSATYGSEMVLQEVNYDFKVGKYYGVAYPKQDNELTFSVEYYSGIDEWNDYYPEKLWEKQLTEDLRLFLSENNISFSIIEVHYPLGAAMDMNRKEELPPYDQVDFDPIIIIEMDKKEEELVRSFLNQKFNDRYELNIKPVK